MTTTNESCGLSHQDKHDIQDAEIGERLKHIKNKILVMSGKGGVGKSSMAAYKIICWQVNYVTNSNISCFRLISLWGFIFSSLFFISIRCRF